MLMPAADGGPRGGGRTMTQGLKKTWAPVPAGSLASGDFKHLSSMHFLSTCYVPCPQ